MKHFKILNSPSLRKRRFLYNRPGYLPAILTAMLLGTYLDLYFTGIGMYSFPSRPFEEVFQIHIVFNLIGLPVFVWIFLWAAGHVSRSGRFILMIIFSLAGPVLEVVSESRKLFLHTGEWKHWYSFIGYFIFLFIVWTVFTLTQGGKYRNK